MTFTTMERSGFVGQIVTLDEPGEVEAIAVGSGEVLATGVF
jgi:hypothetical protein